MKLIPLTQGKFAMVDDEDYEFLMEFNWYAKRAPRTWYARTNVGSGRTRTTMTMHQLIAGVINVDHADRNGLCNMKYNLRLSTLSQNHGNQAKTLSKTTSKYKGVHRRRDSSRWRAYIGAAGKSRQNLGSFLSEEDAAVAYDMAAVRRYGEFARLNFPDANKNSQPCH